jgi:hypothetical protein
MSSGYLAKKQFPWYSLEKLKGSHEGGDLPRSVVPSISFGRKFSLCPLPLSVHSGNHPSTMGMFELHRRRADPLRERFYRSATEEDCRARRKASGATECRESTQGSAQSANHGNNRPATPARRSAHHEYCSDSVFLSLLLWVSPWSRGGWISFWKLWDLCFSSLPSLLGLTTLRVLGISLVTSRGTPGAILSL